LSNKGIKILKTFSISILISFFLIPFFSCRPKEFKIPEPPRDRHQPFNFIGKQGMVVAAHPLAAQAGLEMLKKGGNAVDAAVTTAFALNASEPFASGIGGGGFMVIHLASEKKTTVINFRERAPSAAYPEMFIDEGKTREDWRRTHGLAVAVPGALAGWDYALKKYGTKKLDEVMKRAIEIAEKGFIVSDTFSAINKDEYEKLLMNGGEESCYLNGGFPFEPGDTFQNEDLARTFKRIAANGIPEFYKGEIARKIVKAVKEKGGVITSEDLGSYEPIEQAPLNGTYKDYTIFTNVPPGSGGLLIIQLLNILENWDTRKWGHNSPTYIHHFSEALRFVFADRGHYLGDPEFISIPMDRLTSKEYAAQIVSKIRPDRPLDSYPYGKFDESENNKDNTTHLCVVDKEGNIVSLTQTINHFFGSGIIPEGTGFLLNNQMDDFSRNPSSLNAPRPRRRPLSSMGPLILFKGEKPFLVLGSPGGTRIFSSLTQIIINIVEFNMSLDEAIEAPRFFSYSVGGKPRSIFFESRIPEEIIKSLKKMGHGIEIKKDYDKYFGGAQGILILHDKKIIYGGADSRRDGFGAGY
jgi:gamma-glutamyltranspeptidase/glutathione hydrolase